MSETDSTKSKRKLPIIAFSLPWRSRSSSNLTFVECIKSRTFSISYLAIIWILILLLDFGSTRNCGPTWQLAFICEQSIWMGNIYLDSIQFIRSLITAPFYHNGLDHILFVTIVGFFMIVQSFEVRNNSVATAVLFFSSIAFVATVMAPIINWGYSLWPELDFYKLGMARSWMGGSAGFFGVFGALSHNCRSKWLIPVMVISFEVCNFFILNISPQISLAHTMATLYGFTVWGIWINYKKKVFKKKPN